MHTSVIYFTHSGVRSCVEIKYQVSLSARELPFLVICQQNSWLCPQRINYTCDTLYYKPQLLASMYTTGFLQVCHLDTSTQHCCKVTAIQEVTLTTNWHLSWRNSLQYWKKNHQLSLDNEMYLITGLWLPLHYLMVLPWFSVLSILQEKIGPLALFWKTLVT